MFSRIIAGIIIAVSCLSADAIDLPTKKINNKEYYYYQTENKQTIYSISRKLGISTDDIIKYNPSVADGLRKHIVLYFPVSAFNNESSDGNNSDDDNNNDNASIYVVKDNETLYSIAKKNGLTVREIENANPDLTTLKKGRHIRLPDREKVVEVIEEPADATDKPETETNNENREIPAEPDKTTTPEVTKPDAINIAIMLPFMLDDENPSKQALLFTDFYKGFLIAADSLRNIGTPINIYAYDTADSLNLVKEILKRDEMKKMNAIIAPEDGTQLEEIVKFGNKQGYNVINIFSVKDELYRTHANMLHANIPHKAMYGKAIDHLIENLDGYTPVFVVNSEGNDDKAEFIIALKSRLNSGNGHYEEVFFTSALQIEDVASLNDSTRYIFIPQSGSHAELNRILPTLKTLREQTPEATDRLRLFGYPEWTTFRGETLERMHEFNTLVYSRFYNEADSYPTRQLSKTFKKWYGTEMRPTAPVQGILGFDTGMFVISSLHKDGNLTDIPAYSGIQSGFYFVNPENAKGYINETLYFINFRPDGTIVKTSKQ